MLADKEKPHNFCLLSDDQSIVLSNTEAYVTCYSKTHLTAFATSYWFGINTFSISRQQSFQVKRFNIIGCELFTQPPLIMLCTDKRSMVQAQYSSEWTGLWCGTLVRFLCSKMTEPWVVRVYYPLQIFLIDWLLMSVNQTQVGADLRYLLLLRVTYV